MTTSMPPLRYLAADDVLACLPPVDERLDLAERAMVALVGDAEMPAKIGVHPRPHGAFAHAMPALLRGAAADGSEDRLGLKWVAGSPRSRDLGWPAINAVVVLNDALTGIPMAILDGGPITAHRTAAVSGAAIRRFARHAAGRPAEVAVIGAGTQGYSHLPVLAATLPGVALRIHDRHPDRAEALAAAASATDGIGGASVAPDARSAVEGADLVVTLAAFAPPAERQRMTGDWLGPDAVVVAVDYATMVAAEVARTAAAFVVDDRGQFLANRDAGAFDGYPDPGATLGEAFLEPDPPPATGRILVTHLGTGLADVVFGDAILQRAMALGRGIELPR